MPKQVYITALIYFGTFLVLKAIIKKSALKKKWNMEKGEKALLGTSMANRVVNYLLVLGILVLVFFIASQIL